MTTALKDAMLPFAFDSSKAQCLGIVVPDAPPHGYRTYRACLLRIDALGHPLQQTNEIGAVQGS